MAWQGKQAAESQDDFDGFPPELFTFYEGLEKDNSKSYWDAHKKEWDEYVHTPTEQVMAELGPFFGPLRSFRPQRDTRFSADKTPYKEWVGVTSTPQAVGGVGYFLRVETCGIRVAAGAMVMASDQLDRFRAAIVHDIYGPEFEKIAEKLAAKSLPVCSGRVPELKRYPQGYNEDHPRSAFLRWKGAVVIREYDRAEWMHTREALDRIRKVWQAAVPLKEWIDQHVGLSAKTQRPRGGIRKPD